MFQQQYRQPASKHSFSTIPTAEISRSAFDRSHRVKSTFDAGFLVPILVDEALPGDTISCKMNAFSRLSTPLHPIMDNLMMDFFFFAVPNRLVWDNWQKFCGEQTDPGDSTDFLIPQMVNAGGWQVAQLGDYLGLPIAKTNISTSALFFRAYNLIFKEWFRDENLIDSPVVDTDDGPDAPADYIIRKRGKRHDYFTSCLPWPQKGPAVELPLGTSAPVIPEIAQTTQPTFFTNSIGDRKLSFALANQVDYTGAAHAAENAAWDDPGLIADLSSATAATINAIREAFQIQKLYERDARGGTRYTEILRSHFGVTSPDHRLQRPEYLGGGSSELQQQVIPQTGEAGSTPQGHLTSYGTITTSNIGFNKSFTEHCIILGLVSVRGEINYQQGINRMHSRSTRWDFFWPALQNIGEQAVLNKEIFFNDDANDDLVFGYQERWAEYRYKPGQITGFLRSDAPTSLDTWHVAQDFATVPLLNETFINEDPAILRTQAVQSEVQFIFDAWFNYTVARPMPTNSVPGLIDHF